MPSGLLPLPLSSPTVVLGLVPTNPLVNLIGEFRVVANCGAHLVRPEAEIFSGLVDIAVGGPDCFHDLPHVKAATLDRGPAPGSSFSKGYARMALPAQAFIEQCARESERVDLAIPCDLIESVFQASGHSRVNAGVEFLLHVDIVSRRATAYNTTSLPF